MVERGYPRPIMAAFHAMWSIGGAIAALIGAATLKGGRTDRGHTRRCPAWSASSIALAASRFLIEATTPSEDSDEETPSGRSRRPSWSGRSAGSRSALMLAEGVANDWAALQFRDVLGTSVSTAAFAYGAFAVAMTVGRFLTDRVAAVVGPAAIVRWGAAMAAVGLTR